jgi:serine/threonine protein kinase
MALRKRKLTLDIPKVILRHEQAQVVLPHFVQRGNPFDYYQNVNDVAYGAFGTLYVGESRISGISKAIKVLNVGSGESEIKKALNEAEIGIQLKHPSLLPIDEVWYDGIRFFFVMELITPISVETIFKEAPQVKIVLFQQLVSAVSHLFSKGILHRDIKLQNTGLRRGKDGNLDLVLFDYGEATRFFPDYPECVGTFLHMAPEVLKARQYSGSSEVWALMSFLIEIHTEKPMILHLFEGDIASVPQLAIECKIRELKEPQIPAVFREDTSPSGQLMLHILQRGLAIDPTERLTLSELEVLLQELITRF